MTGPAGDADSLGHDCGELAACIALARNRVARGETPDLASLTAHLEGLLDRLVLLPRSARRQLLPGLLGLFEEVEALAEIIDREAGHCRGEITRTGASARAAAAYAKRAGH